MQKVRVFLVGAGPGDEGLITVRGLELVRAADVLVYDQLGTACFVSEAKPGCELYDVGKFAGNHQVTQDRINEILVEKALEKGEDAVIVRLKGGDPFVFGRGGEEALYLIEHGVPFEVVPGVTSAVSAAAYAGIPITQRGYTTSLAISTGHEAIKDESQINWAALGGIGTLVFLMGVKNLFQICNQLMANGKGKDTPAAMVENATMPEQRTVTGTLETLPRLAEEFGIVTPAVLIVGEVVNLRQSLRWFENRPLYGKTLVVTRARTQASTLAKKLRLLGAKVYECPTIAINQHKNSKAVASFLERQGQYDHVIFTSANGVEGFFEQLLEAGLDSRVFYGKKVVCIGPGTAKALKAVGIVADFIPKRFVAEGITPYFEGKPACKIAILRAETARNYLEETLKKQGHQVDIVPIYTTTLERPEISQEVLEKLKTGSIDWVTFTSASTVLGFKELIESEITERSLVPAAVIGPITEKACQEHGFNILAQAEVYTIDGLIEAIIQNTKDQRND
jgi:uroporphyrinogen III methyltransferase/synthase